MRGAGGQKKERESVARGNVSLGMGASDEVRAREGLAVRPLPEKRGEIKSLKNGRINDDEATRINIKLSRQNKLIVGTIVSEKNVILLTDMEVLTGKVLKYIGELPEGTPAGAKELLHLGSRDAVDQTLSRLVRRGELMRAGRGLYLRPVKSRFGAHPPEASKVVEALAAQRGERVAPHGAMAANQLGLTTQVPVREVYLTSGRSRSLKLGAQVIELRHVPEWQLVLPGRPAGAAIRALAWLGPKRAGAALRAIRKGLPQSELQAMVGLRGRLPTWMAEEVSALANGV